MENKERISTTYVPPIMALRTTSYYMMVIEPDIVRTSSPCKHWFRYDSRDPNPIAELFGLAKAIKGNEN
jgi:hypothetical protein